MSVPLGAGAGGESSPTRGVLHAFCTGFGAPNAVCEHAPLQLVVADFSIERWYEAHKLLGLGVPTTTAQQEKGCESARERLAVASLLHTLPSEPCFCLNRILLDRTINNPVPGCGTDWERNGALDPRRESRIDREALQGTSEGGYYSSHHLQSR